MILSSPGFVALAIAVIAALAYVAPALFRMPATAARTMLGLAWLLHAVVLASTLLGASPRFGFAPALSLMVWLGVAVYAVESRLYPALETHKPLLLAVAVLVLLEIVFPGQPMRGQQTFWLPLHLALGIASYGMFAVAVAHALLMLSTEKRMRQAASGEAGGLPLLTLERLTFRFVAAGFVLLTITLLAGFLFSEQIYGRAWVFSHKIVFALLSWLVFAVLLVGRWRLGWRGWHAARWLFSGAILLLLAYVGSRFVLEIILRRAI